MTGLPQKNKNAHFHCLICKKDSAPVQLAVYEHVAFTACGHCGSVTTLPLPEKNEIKESLKLSGHAKEETFPTGREKKQYLKHLKALAQIKPSGRFLDAQCRTGQRVEMARMNGFSDVMGIDINHYCIELAEKRYPKSKYQTTALKDLDKNGFDIIYSAHALENTPDPDTYIEILLNHLAPDGRVFLTLCDGNHFMIPQSFLNWRQLRYPERAHYISRRGLETLLKRHNLIIEKRFLRFLPYQHVIVKRRNKQ